MDNTVIDERCAGCPLINIDESELRQAILEQIIKRRIDLETDNLREMTKGIVQDQVQSMVGSPNKPRKKFRDHLNRVAEKALGRWIRTLFSKTKLMSLAEQRMDKFLLENQSSIIKQLE